MNINSELLDKLKQKYSDLIEDEPEDGYYHLYYSQDNGPYNQGNSDDCYNSGFEAGAKEGQLDILKMLFE